MISSFSFYYRCCWLCSTIATSSSGTSSSSSCSTFSSIFSFCAGPFRFYMRGWLNRFFYCRYIFNDNRFFNGVFHRWLSSLFALPESTLFLKAHHSVLSLIPPLQGGAYSHQSHSIQFVLILPHLLLLPLYLLSEYLPKLYFHSIQQSQSVQKVYLSYPLDLHPEKMRLLYVLLSGNARLC